ncbi:hypothetical protein [Streptomyces noursei]|uniref:hypothetical protein n=1 Tax=Streptomyces noursei TaxID=1971 RepID=UPI0023B792D7|nr:hypothetical protein [Streptomyces noursei]
MLLLGDAAFDAVEFLREVTATGAQFLARSSARRRPTIQRRPPDGSYPARLAVPTGPGTASLLDHKRHPAGELVEL